MKEGWVMKTLGEICEIKTGNANTEDAIENGEFAFFDRSKIIKRSSSYLFDCEAIIIAGEGQKFLPKYYAGKFNLHQRAYAIFNFSETVNIHFVYKYLIHFHEYFEQVAVGATVKSLRLRHFQDLPLPIPSLAEQKRIVDKLDKAFIAIDTAKANAEQNLKNARELFESYLQIMFKNKSEVWEEKTLGDVCEISSKLIDPRKKEYHELIHIGAGNIESQKGTLVNLKTAKEENLISGKFLFDESMVLYSKIRPYLMKVINCNFKGLCSADIYPLVPLKGKLIKDYLYYLLSSKDFTDFAILGSQRAGMPKVNRDHLFSYKFYLPPIESQKAFVQKLQQITYETQKLEVVYKQKIESLEEFRKSILTRAFYGNL
jgi:type I restriction enzyme S subunit